jgi:serine/threonine-protein kinase
VIFGGFLLAYLLVAFLVFPSGVIPRDAKIPNVGGLQIEEAVKRLAERGFKGERGEERFHGAAPKGTVLEQTPAAGTHDVEGTLVTLVVSAGQKFGTVPTVIGMTRDDAANALETAGYEVGDVSERPNSAPRGQIIDMNPKAGTQAPMPSAVAIVVSAGASVVLVPDLVGRTLAQARQLLSRVGLTVGDVQSGYAGSLEQGKITSQSPAAGAQVAVGTKVTLQVTVSGSGAAAP